jgi:spermidine synthase
MTMCDLSPEMLKKFAWVKREGKIEWYDFPYRIFPGPEKVLVMGAGTGNDVAAALRGGAKRVDAVEIDPLLIKMGIEYHPENPYKNQNVRIVIDDGRHFFHATEEHYDVITFGQPIATFDNLYAHFSNIQMDTYLYTIESFRAAYDLLAPGEIMAVNIGARDWTGKRMTDSLRNATGQEPLAFRNEGMLLFHAQENTYSEFSAGN